MQLPSPLPEALPGSPADFPGVVQEAEAAEAAAEAGK
jgi:hypothetical protein